MDSVHMAPTVGWSKALDDGFEPGEKALIPALGRRP